MLTCDVKLDGITLGSVSACGAGNGNGLTYLVRSESAAISKMGEVRKPATRVPYRLLSQATANQRARVGPGPHLTRMSL